MSDRAELYERELGREARERQERLAGERWPCCGEARDAQHHVACSKRPDEQPVVVHADQGSLL